MVLQSDSESSSPGIIFGDSRKPVQNASSKSVTTVAAGTNSQIPPCPQCNSRKVWRDGHWTPTFGERIQRWSCRECEYKFSDPKDLEKAKKAFQQVEKIESMKLKSQSDIHSTRQICVKNDKETKNLVAEQQTIHVPQKRELDLPKIRGAIVEFIWHLQKHGYSEDTYMPYSENLKFLAKNGADLYDPEHVKDVVASLKKTDIRKWNLIKAYRCFMDFTGLKAEMPVYNYTRSLPYIPRETELDQLIAGCASYNKQMSTFLQLLKETGMRAGEAYQLTWNDLDDYQKTLSVKPEKGSNPRLLRVSDKLVMLICQLQNSAVPDLKEKIFSWKRKIYIARSFRRMRKRIVKNTGNQNLLKIHFHTFRHWVGTKVFLETKLIPCVMAQLGHKSWSSAEIYVSIAQVLATQKEGTEKYLTAVARTLEEALALTNAGYSFDTDWGPEVKIYKKKAPLEL